MGEGEAKPTAGDAAPNSQAEQLRMARDLTVQRQLDEAVALYREIARDDPSNVKARNNLGVLYDELGHHELALEQFEAARALDPDGVEVLVNLCSVLGSLGRLDDAEREARSCADARSRGGRCALLSWHPLFSPGSV